MILLAKDKFAEKKYRRSKPKDSDFLHKPKDIVIYIGGLYEKYKNEQCEILNRATVKNGSKQYSVKFLVDGYELGYVMEKCLVKELEKVIDNKNENEREEMNSEN